MQSHPQNQRQRSNRHADGSVELIRTMHDVFSDPYRRAVLFLLQESEQPVEVDEVVRQVLARYPACDDDPRADSSRARLLEEHIACLDEFGLVARGSDRETIRLSDNASITVTPPWDE